MVSSATWLARLLTFEIPIASLSKRERKYAKRMESLLEIWTSADGTPLASRATQTVFGRAFVVVGFEARSDEENVFSLVQGRLITVRKIVKTLQVW